MLTYLFDASAAIEFYSPSNEKTGKMARFIVDQRRIYKKAALYIPNICIAEVFNTLARKHFRDGDLTREDYERCVNRFRKDIHWGKTFYPYEVNRYHIVAVDEIIPIEHHVASEHDRDHLSTFDIILIAMACELAYVGEPEETFLVTCDRRIKKVFDQLKTVDPAVREGWGVPGGLDDRSVKRWLPPNALYLRATKARDVKTVPGQPALNL